MSNIQPILKKYFGYERFRKYQEEIISNMIKGRDTVAIMPTGAGKSLCYQLPAIVSEGVTIVISPLISLMKDQVDYLKSIGVEATYLNSSLTNSEFRQVLSGIYENKYKIIYVAPERLENDGFVNIINHQDISCSNIIIDEAHCVSRWGHDFRPSYTKIKQFIDLLEVRPVVAAFTATATKGVQEDIIQSLGLKNPKKFITSFDRKNLEFKVFLNENKEQYIKDYIRNHASETGIIYVATRKDAEKLYDILLKANINAALYHAGLSDSERNEAQEDFIYDKVSVMIATNAFGMGIDKSNVRYVIHYNMPRDLESYYQEAGRAGRDGEDSVCILLYSSGDTAIQKYFIDESDLPEDYKSNEYKKLQVMESYCHTSSCLRKYMLEYFGDYSIADSCGNCSVCNADTEEQDVTLQAQMILSCIHRSGQRFGRSVIVDTLRGSKNQRVINFHLNELKTYGLMKDYSKTSLDLIMNKLIAEGYIHKTQEQYPVLKLTELSIPLLKNQGTLTMQVAKKEVRKITENVLFSNLKEVRTRVALREGYPPYVIFHDSTLLEMSSRLPSTLYELGEIKGVGENKLLKYGQEFLDVILEYTQNSNYNNQSNDERSNDSELVYNNTCNNKDIMAHTNNNLVSTSTQASMNMNMQLEFISNNNTTEKIYKNRNIKMKDNGIATDDIEKNSPRNHEELHINEKGYKKYYKLYSEGKTLEEIRELLDVTINTVERNLLIAYREGDDVDIDRFIQKEFELEIVKVIINEEWDGRLRYIKERLPEEVNYLTIKSVIAKLKLKLFGSEE